MGAGTQPKFAAGETATMRYQRFGDTYFLRLDPDRDIPTAIVDFAADQCIDAGTVTGIGTGHDWVLGFFDRSTCEYARQAFGGEWEILALGGNLAIKDGRPFAHLHVVLGGPDFRTVGGHLFEGSVSSTAELVIRKLPGYQLRGRDEATGLHLLEL